MVDGRTVRLGAVEQVNVRVSRHPGATLFSVLIKDVFAGNVHGVPALWRDTVRRALPPGAAAVVGPVLASRACWMSDRLALIHDLGASDMRTIEGELAATDPGVLAEEVAAYHASAQLPPAWRPLLDDPAAFLAAYLRVVAAAWASFEPLWRQADVLMGREAERVGLAAVTGGLDGLLTGLGSGVRYENSSLRLSHACPDHLADLGRRPLVLVPLASGYTASMYGADRDDALWIGYAVPGLGRIAGRRDRNAPEAEQDGLSLVLGPVRAEILRNLRRRLTVSELADHLHVGVSTATYHCQHLEAAGLLHRERHGRQVRLHPTERGTALTHLLAAPAPPLWDSRN
ncbi:helix-turn-helix domain-containing protein [Streptomyces sp. ISL-36]|uniref:helix-turn-helix domain-containing protein n=1 Tax=Streptomyces sp. ISL-36 TaxID=2819182 RepID=UPI001BE88ED4|nr:helix-turn-helix domain-containing protein [Streptomyces sp. ISL-36]MBT2442893.1 helix-turn-helix domain-containing protein [Streptomyces sp. ISL-36]